MVIVINYFKYPFDYKMYDSFDNNMLEVNANSGLPRVRKSKGK